MLAASNTLMVLAIICVMTGVVSALLIVSKLEKHGVKINWIWMRLFIVTRYVGQYREITVKESGRPGNLYYVFVTAMSLALLLAFAGLALRSW